MLSDDIDACGPTAHVYKTSEEARLLLKGLQQDGLGEMRRAVVKAAFYLSDAIEPEDRDCLLRAAQIRLEIEREDATDAGPAGEALSLLDSAAGEVEQMLRGPNASSELRIALRALRNAISGLAHHLALPTDHLSRDRRPRRSGEVLPDAQSSR
jgi:hypothetical protein